MSFLAVGRFQDIGQTAKVAFRLSHRQDIYLYPQKAWRMV